MKLYGLRVNQLHEPVGYAMEETVFSWKVEDAEAGRADWARVEVAEDEDFAGIVADTGEKADADSLQCPVDVPLKPRTRYWFRVTVKAGEECAQAVSFFETGKRDEPWSAKWIGCDNTEKRHPVFAKTLGLPVEGLVCARLYICGLGLYEAELGGMRVGDEILTPYCNNYNAFLQAQTYDVTENLRGGDELKVTLGNGWYKGRFGYASKADDGAFYGSEWKLIAEVHAFYQDGTERIVGTDDSFAVTRSNIIQSNIYDGEQVDDTLAPLPAEKAVILENQDLPLTDRRSTPVRKREVLPAKELIITPKDEMVFDIGQNIAGLFRLHVHVPAGRRVYLQFGEILQGGCFYRDNLRTALAEYTWISDGSDHVIEPKFTFYGYRFAKVEGVDDLKVSDFEGVAIYSEFPMIGSLVTEQPLINQLIENTRWGQKDNFIDVPTDCPQRDERMGWTADTQVFTPTALFTSDAAAFYRKYLYDMGTEQKAFAGLVPNVVPSFGMEETSSVWGDAATIIPWNVYRFTGDPAVLRENYENMKAWIAYVEKVDGDDHGWRRAFHFGDWLALDGPDGIDGVMGGTEVGFIADAYYRNSCLLTAKAARVLGKEDEAKLYEAKAEKILEGLHDEYYSKNGRLCIDTQTGHILTWYFDLCDRARAKEGLLKKLKESKKQLRTGFVGTALLNRVLSDMGEDELAYHLLFNEEYPGWLYEIRMGATTVWERWNSVMPDGWISSTGMNSLNHYAYGSIVEWIWERCAGLNPVEEAPGFRKAWIAPCPVWRLGSVDAVNETPAGRYEIHWKALTPTKLSLSVTVPFGAEGYIVLPYAGDEVYADASNPLFADVREIDGKKVCVVPAGNYSVAYKTSVPMKKVYSSQTKIRDLQENKEVWEAVKQIFPAADQVPGFALDGTMRDVMARYGMTGQEGLLQALDEKLAAF